MRPWYALRPPQLDGLRVATVADPVAVSRAWALQLLADGPGRPPRRVAARPEVGPSSRPLARPVLGRGADAGRRRPASTRPSSPGRGPTRRPSRRGAADRRAAIEPASDDPDARRLLAILRRYDQPRQPGGRLSRRLLNARPEALVEAVEILIRRPDAVRAVLTRPGYTDPATIGGYLDRDLADPQGAAADLQAPARPPRRPRRVPSGSSRRPSGRIGPTTATASTSATAAIAQASQ